ncbi:MAG: hypothetical protein JWQ47_2277 [Glaciihabitans sp.]|nr:hypothetical protein [Glaciihabitans sp.]
MTLDEDRTHAKQLEMLSIDERYAERWVTTMRGLVARRLGNEAFVAKRMALLHRWEKDRKREQHNLHYKYDPLRRNPRLVDRDVKTTTAALRARYEEIIELRLEREEDREDVHQVDTLAGETSMGSAGPTPSKTDKPLVRSLNGISPTIIELVSTDTGITKLQYATDDEVRQAFLRNVTGINDAGIQNYLDMLNGVHPDWPRGGRDVD